jgi:hypothetical protein
MVTKVWVLMHEDNAGEESGIDCLEGIFEERDHATRRVAELVGIAPKDVRWVKDSDDPKATLVTFEVEGPTGGTYTLVQKVLQRSGFGRG